MTWLTQIIYTRSLAFINTNSAKLGTTESHFTDPADVWQRIPAHHKKTIREKNLRLFFTDMVQIAREVASVADLEMRMQGIVLLGVFLKLTPYAADSGMSDDEVYDGVESALRKYFGNRGEQVVQDNLTCVKRGYSEMQEISQEIIQGLQAVEKC